MATKFPLKGQGDKADHDQFDGRPRRLTSHHPAAVALSRLRHAILKCALPEKDELFYGLLLTQKDRGSGLERIGLRLTRPCLCVDIVKFLVI
jgi:hypothetical protein